MSKHRIPNEKWIEFISEIATQLTELKFIKGAFWFDAEQNQTTFTEEAQDFFNERYDEVETLLEDILDIQGDRKGYYE